MADDEISVGALVEAARAGSSDAWAALVDQFSPMILAVARRYRLSDADVNDAYQTVWLKLTEHLDRIREPDRIAGWLATTTRNEALRLVQRPTTSDLDLDLYPIDDDGPDDWATRREFEVGVAAAFAKLTHRCRELLRYLVVDGRSYREVSDLMTMPMGSIGPTRERCLASLRGHLDQGTLEPI